MHCHSAWLEKIARGICLYRKLGFFEEGILKRDFLISGESYDSLLMGLQID